MNTKKRIATIASLAIVGLALAAGVAFATNTPAGTAKPSVGLSADGVQHWCVQKVAPHTFYANVTLDDTKCPAGTTQEHGKWGGAAPVIPVTQYGVAQILVSRGGADATVWDKLSTPLGGPVGDKATGTFRFTCSAAKAPCFLSVNAYATTDGYSVYPRVLINKSDINTGAPLGQCEYADGTTNDGGTVTLAGDSTPVPLAIGGSLDCGSDQAYPTGGVVDEIKVPAGYYDVYSEITFVK
jgi:hypothetical protein